MKRTIDGIKWVCVEPGRWWAPEKKVLAEQHFKGGSNEEWLGYASDEGDPEKVDRCDFAYYSLTFTELARDVARKAEWNEAIERAAKLCEESAGTKQRTEADRERNRTCLTLASAIRRLRK